MYSELNYGGLEIDSSIKPASNWLWDLGLFSV